MLIKKVKRKISSVKRNIKKAPLSYYVVFSLIMILLYTIVSMILDVIWQIQYDTLTTCWFSVWGGEVLTCGLIKIFKLKGEDEDGN